MTWKIIKPVQSEFLFKPTIVSSRTAWNQLMPFSTDWTFLNGQKLEASAIN